MSMLKTWYTPQEAAEKFGVEQRRILEWVEQGIVRSEDAKGKVLLINGDDLDLKVQEITGI
jgi:excisionase family DNA binding protein